MMNLINKLNRLNGKKKFVLSWCGAAIFGIINLLINWSNMLEEFETAGKTVLISVVGAIIISLLTELLFCAVFSLVLYFFMAAIDRAENIRNFFGRAAAMTLCIPLISLTNTVSYACVGHSFSEFGIVGKLAFIPFFIINGLYCITIAVNSWQFTKKQAIILTGIITLILIFSV